MSDDPGLQVGRKCDEPSLIISPARSSLIVRGRQDAALLVLPCNKCGERKQLVLAGCVCANCSEAFDSQWAGSTATDWVLVAFRGPEPPGREGTRSDSFSRVWEALDEERTSREELEKLKINSKNNPWWPLLYIYANATYSEVKSYWAKRDPPDSLCLGPMTIDEFARKDGDASVYANPWPLGRAAIRDAVPYVRPATPQEIAHRLKARSGYSNSGVAEDKAV